MNNISMNFKLNPTDYVLQSMFNVHVVQNSIPSTITKKRVGWREGGYSAFVHWNLLNIAQIKNMIDANALYAHKWEIE